MSRAAGNEVGLTAQVVLMATCPSCGVSSREDPGAIVVEDVLQVSPPGTFSLSGSSLKASATSRLRMRCDRCGWSVLGHIEGDDFVANPKEQTWPKPPPTP